MEKELLKFKQENESLNERIHFLENYSTDHEKGNLQTLLASKYGHKFN